MDLNYRFRIQRVLSQSQPRFQLRIGMNGDGTLEYVPAHQTAFAREISVEKDHAAEVDAHLEASVVFEWLRERHRR